MQNKRKTLLVWVVLLTLFLVLFSTLKGGGNRDVQFEFSQFLADLDQGLVTSVRVNSNEIHVTLHGGHGYRTLGLIDDELTEKLSERGVTIHWGEAPKPWKTVLMIGIPAVFVIALLVFLSKKASSGNHVFQFRRSTARLLDEKTSVSFDDVGGAAKAKDRLRDVISFLQDPDPWIAAGARLPRGVLLEGPPGCGKTLLARAVAGEADAKFFLVSASEFVEMFVGVGAARVRDLFESAMKQAPAVIFIDELDAVGRRRGSGIGAGNDEREQTLNQILVCMDGFEVNDRIVVLAATNRPDILDPALMRPGRFDCRLEIPPPDSVARREILEIHLRNKELDPSVSLDDLAQRTDGLNGADLECLVNEATLRAVRRSRDEGVSHVILKEVDLEGAKTSRSVQDRLFNQLDALLIDSTSQLAQPTGQAIVRVQLDGTQSVEGQVVWADSTMLKLRDENGREVIVPKLQVRSIEALEGTELVESAQVKADPWAAHLPDMA